MCASISCCLLTSHPAAHNGGCADGPGTASGWATHNVACKLPQLAPASLCPPPGCVFPSHDFGGAAGCNHTNFCLEKLPSYPPRIGAGNPAIPTMAGRPNPRHCAAGLIRATSRRNSSSILAKAAAGDLAPMPSSGPMVRSCALSGMGGWHWRDKWLQKTPFLRPRRSMERRGNCVEIFWMGRMGSAAAWVRDPPVWENSKNKRPPDFYVRGPSRR